MENISVPSRPSVASRLRDAIRIAFFLRVPEERLQPGALEIAAAILLTLCVPTLYNAFEFAGDGRLASWEVPQALFHIPMLLVAASVVAWIARREGAIPTLLFATLLAWFVVDVATWLAWTGIEAASLGGKRRIGMAVFYYVPIAWLTLAAARFGIALAPQSVVRRVGILVGSSRVDLQACKLEYSIVSPK